MKVERVGFDEIDAEVRKGLFDSVEKIRAERIKIKDEYTNDARFTPSGVSVSDCLLIENAAISFIQRESNKEAERRHGLLYAFGENYHIKWGWEDWLIENPFKSIDYIAEHSGVRKGLIFSYLKKVMSRTSRIVIEMTEISMLEIALRKNQPEKKAEVKPKAPRNRKGGTLDFLKAYVEKYPEVACLSPKQLVSAIFEETRSLPDNYRWVFGKGDKKKGVKKSEGVEVITAQKITTGWNNHRKKFNPENNR